MEKLIELLNEYSKIRKYNNAEIVEWVEHTKWNLYWRYWENTWSYMVVISKEYGFIDWLIENEKIDLDKIKLFSIFKEDRYYNAYQSILMALSISDTPIEFLISILK